jgi:hypothetical protein
VKAAQAIRQAPGVLAVKVDYKSGQALIGTDRDRPVPRDAILQSLQSIGYTGKFAELSFSQPPTRVVIPKKGLR